MVKPRWGNVLRSVDSLLGEGVISTLSDAELLERYATSGRESAERAFAALVDRHGPMVLRVCRNVLRDDQAAQDAFQATFLVLVRKAGSVWVHDSIGPWLHGVALRTASCARNAAARRRFHERKAAELAPRDHGGDDVDDLSVVHQEVNRLPQRFRAPVVLCYLEGLTHEQAADRLRCPVGTVRSRLATGRDQLRRRLTGRGIAPERSLTEPSATYQDPAGLIPAGLAEAVVRNALVYAATPAAGTVPSAVTALADEGLRIMILARLRTLSLTLLVLGGGAVGLFAFAPGRKEPPKADEPEAQAVAGAGPSRPVASFLETRVKTARQILDLEIHALRDDVPIKAIGFEQIATWSRRLMEDRIRLAGTSAERVEAIREHRNNMACLEELADLFDKQSVGTYQVVAKARYHRVEADQLLAEAGGDPEKEKPVVDLQKFLDPRLTPAGEPVKGPAPPTPAPPLPSRPAPR